MFGELDERQPDLALVRSEALEGSLPGASDVTLVVEVAETSLSYDREIKVPLYTRSGVPEAPSDSAGRYAERSTFGRAEELRSFTVCGLDFAVRDVVGEAAERERG